MENLLLLKYGASTVISLVGNINNDHQKQILDPITSIIRLALLFFKEKGTKISITDNHIIYQSPNILQGTIRWANNDVRNDLSNLCTPLVRAVAWYLDSLDSLNEDDPSNQMVIYNKDMKNLLEYAAKGLERLRVTYSKDTDSSLVCHSISRYIDIVTMKTNVGGTSKPESKIDNSDMKSHIKMLWTDKEINIMNGLYDIALNNKSQDLEYKYIVKTIEMFLDGKDKELKMLLNKIGDSL